MQAFARMPALVDVPVAHRAGRDREAERPLLPSGVENRLVLLGRDRAEAHLPAEILRPVHRGGLASPVPIIESRVTSSASAASSRPSLPAGRCGTTR